MNDSDVAGVGQSGEGCEVEVSCRGVHRHTLRKVKTFIEKNKTLTLYSSVQTWNFDIYTVLDYMYISKLMMYNVAQYLLL